MDRETEFDYQIGTQGHDEAEYLAERLVWTTMPDHTNLPHMWTPGLKDSQFPPGGGWLFGRKFGPNNPTRSLTPWGTVAWFLNNSLGGLSSGFEMAGTRVNDSGFPVLYQDVFTPIPHTTVVLFRVPEGILTTTPTTVFSTVQTFVTTLDIKVSIATPATSHTTIYAYDQTFTGANVVQGNFWNWRADQAGTKWWIAVAVSQEGNPGLRTLRAMIVPPPSPLTTPGVPKSGFIETSDNFGRAVLPSERRFLFGAAPTGAAGTSFTGYVARAARYRGFWNREMFFKWASDPFQDFRADAFPLRAFFPPGGMVFKRWPHVAQRHMLGR